MKINFLTMLSTEKQNYLLDHLKPYLHWNRYGTFIKLKIDKHKLTCVFCLQMRADLIPAIVVLLQKQWRGTICRAKFKKMKAAYFIIKFYRRYKIRTYIKSVLEAHRLAIIHLKF